MLVAIPHSLGKDEVRRRIAAKIDGAEAKVGVLVGGPLRLNLAWIDDHRLSVDASAMGYTVPTTLEITETALVFDVTIPGGLGFARGMIEHMIRERGEKLLA
jgi:hypothetical protein